MSHCFNQIHSTKSHLYDTVTKRKYLPSSAINYDKLFLELLYILICNLLISLTQIDLLEGRNLRLCIGKNKIQSTSEYYSFSNGTRVVFRSLVEPIQAATLYNIYMKHAHHLLFYKLCFRLY